MSKSRKQLIANIALMQKQLYSQQTRAVEHKKYLTHKVDYKTWFVLIFVPVFFLWGWNKGRGKWSLVTNQLVNAGSVAALTFFKRQVNALFL
ncbi:MAG: hypothetical protein Q8M40_08595 [Legionella sp.]|nr:hypothetical protein [Legionella sp.]